VAHGVLPPPVSLAGRRPPAIEAPRPTVDAVK
jgi:hypothetical protein